MTTPNRPDAEEPARLPAGDSFRFHTFLLRGREQDYEDTHRSIPFDLDRVMRAAGVLSWTIRRSGTVLTHDVIAADRERMSAALDIDPVNIAWQDTVAPFLDRTRTGSPSDADGTVIWDFSWPTTPAS